MSIEIEEWRSTQNREEIHYFVRDGKRHGYQGGAYLFGYNPELVSEETAGRIMALIQAERDAR